jgi:hypothetical protein
VLLAKDWAIGGETRLASVRFWRRRGTLN